MDRKQKAEEDQGNSGKNEFENRSDHTQEWQNWSLGAAEGELLHKADYNLYTRIITD
jgi:hypothetical protein